MMMTFDIKLKGADELVLSLLTPLLFYFGCIAFYSIWERRWWRWAVVVGRVRQVGPRQGVAAQHTDHDRVVAQLYECERCDFKGSHEEVTQHEIWEHGIRPGTVAMATETQPAYTNEYHQQFETS